MSKRAVFPILGNVGQPAHDPDEASRTLIEHAYRQLREDIVECRLAPGEKLRVEHLRGRYGVSAGTLREAITRLVSDALVETEGQRGFRVAPISMDDLEDLTRLRLHIEIDALRQSIRRGDAAWRAHLTRAYEELRAVGHPRSLADRRHYEGLNARFHEALLSAHASPWTLRTLRLLGRHGERYRSLAIALADSGRDVHAEHDQIYELAMAGQDARAALALEAHIRATPELLARAQRAGQGVLPQMASPARAAAALATPEREVAPS